MYPDPQGLENIMSIRDAMRQISQEADAVVELLDARIEDEYLDGSTEAQDVRSVLELIQSLTLEVSEQLEPIKSGIRARKVASILLLWVVGELPVAAYRPTYAAW